jgi:misacylated tRNA(Ala) deacylase
MKALFVEDAYLSTAEARVTAVREDGGIMLDQTCFYATSGGQPGDTGFLERDKRRPKIIIAGTVTGESKAEIIHIPVTRPAGARGWRRIGDPHRLGPAPQLMRMHTACHLLSVVCPYPITGAAVSETDSRIDFDMSETIDKAEVTAKLMELVNANHPVFTQWISEDDLAANPDLVKSKNVRPPRGQGRIRLVCIGEGSAIDSQPCGGTHVSETAEVGEIHIGKIEKKGRENRRFRIRFGPAS